jgi:lipoprotein-anchoring transpeptidase ErfK/SrfK
MGEMSRAVSRTPLRLAAGLFGLVAVLALAMFVYDHARRERIATGVTVAGVDVGGLSAPAARARLERQVAGSMERPVVVRWAGRAWTVSPRRMGVVVDVAGSVARAVDVSREGSIFARTWRGITGGSIHRDVPLQVSYSHAQVRGFAAQVRDALDRAPRDATVQPAASGLTEVPDRSGLTVEEVALEHRVEQALQSTAASRTVAVPAHTIEPAVTTGELAARYPAYIVINRESFQLQFYSHLKLASTYPIAVGMQGLETTAGLYHIQWKQVNPPWYVPNSAWAGALAGKVIPPGPEDPLKARFMAFNGGAGIHGIDPSEYGTIGHDASHGCVRMRIPDVIALYARTPVGTPVYVI